VVAFVKNVVVSERLEPKTRPQQTKLARRKRQQDFIGDSFSVGTGAFTRQNLFGHSCS
jgi:hypothetical protein